MSLSLVEKVTALHQALARRRIPHAFGGALALAYYAEPRATIDIDCNLFVPVDEVVRVGAALGRLDIEAASTPEVFERVHRDGQVRVWWGTTPLDLFYAYDEFHRAAAAATRRVPFAAGEVPILAVEHLIACKVVFDRPKDWVDIDAVLSMGTAVDAAEVLRWVGRVAGDTDRRYRRIVQVLMGP